ncbi:zinc finger protein [Babesia ovis]|uniref:Zinc finger protein n=1 Tax=Babesia ovis TaxID=5869 RepID=A0A9W5TCB2_BABOV|nr:zinc finger protein [Babesia ovis]
MGRKSSKRLQLKPFCYFCNREFDEEKVLIMHQKAKHFKCGECNRKLETANGLAVHMQQVHKLIQRKVPFALEGRDNITSVVQGMQGIPFEAIEEHQLKHQKKMGDIDTRKQQRISWAIVSMAPTPEQFLAQLAVGNVYFPGFTAPQENLAQPRRHLAHNPYAQIAPYAPEVTPNHGQQGVYPMGQTQGYPGKSAGFGGAEKRGRQFSSGSYGSLPSQEEPVRQMGLGTTNSGPLILGPSGTPIDLPHAHGFSSTVTSSRPAGVAAVSATNSRQGFTTAPTGFSNGPPNSILNPTVRPGFGNSNGFQKTGGFSDGDGFKKTGGFSDANGFQKMGGFSASNVTGNAPSSFSGAKGFSDSAPKSTPVAEHKEHASREVEKHYKTDESRAAEPQMAQTQYYKATGVAPLFIPPPSLGNTQLAYDIDTESIEERRARLMYNWQGSD